MNIQNERKIQTLILIICLALFAVLLIVANNSRGTDVVPRFVYHERGRVISILEEIHTPFPQQILEVEVLSGEFQGFSVEARNNLLDRRLRSFYEGDRIIIALSDHDILVSSPDRLFPHVTLIALFIFLLALIGGKRGVLSIIGLAFSMICIIFILVPMTLAGHSSITMALVIGILITIVSITLLAGFNAKSLSAILGCISGVVVATVFASIAGHFALLNGYHLENAGMLSVFGPEISLSGIFISGVIIAAIGAITDTAMTIASSMEEVKKAHPSISSKDLFRAGLNVGRDAMGTMSNTLILAFVGSSFSLILLIASMNVSMIELINDFGIGIEIIQGIAGSIGIILTVPITTLIAAKLLAKMQR